MHVLLLYIVVVMGDTTLYVVSIHHIYDYFLLKKNE